MATIKISPSILAADFGHLARDIGKVADFADSLHVDVMDGHFVPNISIGPAVSNAVKAQFRNLPLNIHLMISDPEKYAPAFEVDQQDTVIFHVEAVDKPRETVEKIQSLGPAVGVSLNPDTDPESLSEILPYVDHVLVMSVYPGFGGQEFMSSSLKTISSLRAQIDKREAHVEIAVDGGINPDTAGAVAKAGADVLVAGSAIFGQKDPGKAVREMRSAVRPL